MLTVSRGAQQGARGSAGCRGGAQLDAECLRREPVGLGGICGSRERRGGTDPQAQRTPKNGGALCVSPTLFPKPDPWPGCALWLINPHRPDMGPPQRYKLTGRSLDSHVLPTSPLCCMYLARAQPLHSLPQFPFPTGVGMLATPFPSKLIPARQWGCWRVVWEEVGTGPTRPRLQTGL